jgi:cysteinyl-tRNA synthetase
MSKSLKNFISIKEYFQHNLTSNPAEDFRIFCLQFKYSTGIHFSYDRIKDAEIYRKKIIEFLSLVDNIYLKNNTNFKVYYFY